MYYFRADGNAKIGAGHLMRCLTIAGALAEKCGTTEEILFLCADEESAGLAERQGFRTRVLYTDYQKMETELAILVEILKEKVPGAECMKADPFPAEPKRETAETFLEQKAGEGAEAALMKRHNILVVDSYYVTEKYLKAVSRLASVLLLDDMGERAWPVDGILNYNAFAEPEYYRSLYAAASKEPLYGIGSSFVPLRSQFQNVPYKIRETVQNVLITTGGGDSNNIAGQIWENLYQEDVAYHVVIGRFNPYFSWWEEKEAECSKKPECLVTNAFQKEKQVKAAMCGKKPECPATNAFQKEKQVKAAMCGKELECPDAGVIQNQKPGEAAACRLYLHTDVQDMAGLMAQCDLAVTAGGTTIYELAAVGVPFLCFSYAENQEALTEYIGRKQIAGYCGAWHKGKEAVLEALKTQMAVCRSKAVREHMSEKEKRMTDGDGAVRCVELIRSCAGR